MQRKDWLFSLGCVLCLLDAAMTVPMWHLETNPLVLAMGPVEMTAIKLFGVIGASLSWFSLDAREHIVAVAFGYSLTILYSIVVGSNLLFLATQAF